MSLDPAVAQKLSAEIPELKAFRLFLTAEAMKLNSLQGLAQMPANERAIEVTARLRAFETITAILKPVINISEEIVRTSPSEYVL